MMSTKLPRWLRFFLLVGIAVFAAGAGLLAYRYYTRPATLTVAVGSIDGEAAKRGRCCHVERGSPSAGELDSGPTHIAGEEARRCLGGLVDTDQVAKRRETVRTTA
jgi:hypothetical protein